MNKNEIKAMVFMLNSAYPSQVRPMSETEQRAQLTLWHEMFRDDDSEVVGRAVKRIIGTSRFYPSIADIRKAVLQETLPDLNEQFDELLSMAKASWKYEVVGFRERSLKYKAFDRLSLPLQRYVGSPNGLQDLLVEYDNNHSYCRKRFMKDFPEILERSEMDVRLGLTERKLLEGEK